MQEIHNFSECLQRSHNASDDPFWLDFYAFHFPANLGTFVLNANGQPQYMGVDRLVVLPSGKTLYVDEKVRGRDYNDIALEFVSNNTKGTLGWVEKPLICDFIAYAIFPKVGDKRGYLLPVPQLQSTWITNKERWLREYGSIKAYNKGYQTLCCPVPWDVLKDALRDGMEFIKQNEDIPF
jgi:hypothetical protein